MLVWATVEVCSRATALSLRQFCLPLAKGSLFDTPGSHSEEIENFAFRLVQVQAGRPLPGRWSACCEQNQHRLAPSVGLGSQCFSKGRPQWWAVGSLCRHCACVCGLPPGTGLPFWPLLCERLSFWYCWRSLIASNIFNIFQFLAHFTALARHQCRDTISSLNVQVLLLWRAITRRHHLLACDHLNFIAYHVKHTFEDYITQQTYVQHNANAQSASTSQLWTTSWLKLLQFAFLFKGFHQSGMLNRCQCNYLAILWHPLFKDAFSASDTLITS